MFAGARFKRWFWQGLELGAIGGVGFAVWLFWISMYQIRALCPFCLTVDAVVYTLFWYITLYNIREGHITIPSQLKKTVSFAQRHHLDILLFLFLAIAVLILHHFWYYFGEHLL